MIKEGRGRTEEVRMHNWVNKRWVDICSATLNMMFMNVVSKARGFVKYYRSRLVWNKYV